MLLNERYVPFKLYKCSKKQSTRLYPSACGEMSLLFKSVFRIDLLAVMTDVYAFSVEQKVADVGDAFHTKYLRY